MHEFRRVRAPPTFAHHVAVTDDSEIYQRRGKEWVRAAQLHDRPSRLRGERRLVEPLLAGTHAYDVFREQELHLDAVGLAVAEGRFRLDDKVISFFPQDVPAEISDNLAAMQVRHLLTMSTGQEGDLESVLDPSAFDATLLATAAGL